MNWYDPKLVTALRRMGCRSPWRVAWSIFKTRFLPHRTYLYSDHEGFIYRPQVLQFRIGLWMIWQDGQEIARQKSVPTRTTEPASSKEGTTKP